MHVIVMIAARLPGCPQGACSGSSSYPDITVLWYSAPITTEIYGWSEESLLRRIRQFPASFVVPVFPPTRVTGFRTGGFAGGIKIRRLPLYASGIAVSSGNLGIIGLCADHLDKLLVLDTFDKNQIQIIGSCVMIFHHGARGDFTKCVEVAINSSLSHSSCPQRFPHHRLLLRQLRLRRHCRSKEADRIADP